MKTTFSPMQMAWMNWLLFSQLLVILSGPPKAPTIRGFWD
jgi:hypothetical protein